MAFKFSNLSRPMGGGGNHLDPDTAIIDDLLDDPIDGRSDGRGEDNESAMNALSNCQRMGYSH